MIRRMGIFIDLAGVLCFERLLHQTSLNDLCMEFTGLGGIRLGAVFYSGRLVSEGALRSSAGCYHYGAHFLVPL
jgi:hypothetical protein